MGSLRYRVAMYSHDTYGLGHLTRTLRLARATVEAIPSASVLILTGSPVAHRFVLPPSVDYVKLPSVVKLGHETYASRTLDLSPRRIRNLRATTILNTIASFRPHLFLVDNVPLGMKGELRPTLDFLKGKRGRAHVCLDLRDILDDREIVLSTWAENGTLPILEEMYDSIHVFGSPEVYDAVAAYALPAAKTVHLGYLAPSPGALATSTLPPPAARARASVLVTVGGGGDGAEIVGTVLDLQSALGSSSPYQFHIVAGPLMSPEVRQSVGRRMQGLEGVTLHEYVDGLPAWMAACDLVLSMGGYNTLCEVMACARRAVVIPRIHPRREQEIRARALETRRLLRVLDPRTLGPRALDEALSRTLEEGPCVAPERCPPLTGIPRFQNQLRERATLHLQARPVVAGQGLGRACWGGATHLRGVPITLKERSPR